MSTYVRPKVTGATVFFTICLADRQSDLLVRALPHLRDAVRRTRTERPFESLAWVVLPDHLHCVWRLPAGDRDFSTRWGAIKARFTMSIGRAGFSPPTELPVVTSGRHAGLKPGLRRTNRERAVWQRRFWEHHIRDDQDLAAHIRYCWLNPVKHGLVTDPTDWRYSSIHRDLRLRRVDPDITGAGPDLASGEPR